MRDDLNDANDAALKLCVALDQLPGHIKDRYRRLILISREAHLRYVDAGDEDTLIVCCDWLLWQRLLRQGRHVVHYELGILGWPESDSIKTDIMIRANDWVYASGRDLTEFRGVSLGRLFMGEVSMCLMNYYRLARSLGSLLRHFQPAEILFCDFINDINYVSRDLRKRIVAGVAAEAGVRVTDAEVFSSPADACAGAAPSADGPWGRSVLIFFYTWTVEALTRLRCLFADCRKRVLVQVITNIAEPLALNFHGARSGLTPIFMSRTLPKTFAVVWQALRHGIILAAPPRVRLDAADRQRLAVVEADLAAALDQPASGALAVVQAYLRENVVDRERLVEKALQVRLAERILDRFRPRRVIVDGVRNAPPRAYVELAGPRGIAVDYYWHSPQIPLIEKVDALGADPRLKPMVDRNLSWGEINDRWLDAVDSDQPRVRVGSALSDRYRIKWPARPARIKNVLMLQYTPNVTDLRGLNCNMYSSFVHGIRMLKAIGITDIWYKLHPGPERWEKTQFEHIAAEFGLSCRILKREPFYECLAWADVIIGPVQSGAMFEALAAGKPYYALLIPPHSMDTSYYGDYPLYPSLEALIDAMSKNTPSDGGKLLDDLYSTGKFPRGSERFWQVLKADFSASR